MTDNRTEQSGNPAQMAADFDEIANQSQRIVDEFLARLRNTKDMNTLDPLNMAPAFAQMASRLLANPAPLIEAQTKLWEGYLQLWQQTARRAAGEPAGEPVATPDRDDRRFRDPAWSENLLFDHIKQAYLLAAECLQSTAANVEGLDEKDAQKVVFHTRQFVDAVAPSNFAASNPAVLRETVETKGQNLVRGLKNVLDDLERGDGQRLDIRMTDDTAFEIGGNLALTPGKVVFQNDLIQLIQYAPTTETVHTRPLLIIPPWINKFYILDLQPRNSFVSWAVSKGYTVFIVSWVNPDSSLAAKTFEDYLLEGPCAALDAIEQATGAEEVGAIGYCLGGTLLAATLGYLAARGDRRIKSATFFATLVDFAEPGELGVFIDDTQVASLEEAMRETGYLEGRHMATTFSMLRANDLIWSFVVNNYLMGKDPLPFDLLYWNSDSTRMPAKMHSFYLREMYQKNNLARPGGLTLAGETIDLGQVKTPVYIVAAREDHIAPWTSCYAGTQLYGGQTRFVLGASGHIAGIINPPAAQKYGHWTGTVRRGQAPDAWLEAAEQHDGSWWNDWHRWQARRAGKKVAARTPGDGALPAIEDAPGSYVRTRA